MRRGPSELLERFELTEYEATALGHLIEAGRTTAPDIAEATGIPKARIYGVLDSLADQGYVKVIPGRPKHFQPKSPEDILRRAKENRRQEYEEYCQGVESIREEFLSEFQPLFERATEDLSPTSELFYVVDVGDPSESETRQLYENADREVHVITNSFAYFEDIEPELAAAIDRGVDVSALFLDPDLLPDEKRTVQSDIVDRLRTDYPDVGVRFSEERLPWRGTFVDPSMDYDSGKAILLVEEKEVPNYKRQAAVTENGSFVAGMKRYFDLIWEYESFADYPA